MPFNENQFDREEADIWRRNADGLITNKQAWEEQRQLQRDVRAAYEEDRERALRDVDAEWGL